MQVYYVVQCYLIASVNGIIVRCVSPPCPYLEECVLCILFLITCGSCKTMKTPNYERNNTYIIRQRI